MQSARTKRSAGLPGESTSGARALADLDTQLMLQARGGNSEAANTLIRRNAPRITRYIARLIGARTMFIDSIANARELSISARLALGVADRVLSQWPRVAELTGAEYRGAVI